MTQKTRNIIGWTVSIVLALLFLFSAFMKIAGAEEVVKNSAAMGLTAADMQLLGIVEVLSIVLFLIPRTGVLGTLLLAAYLGGAIATHLEHQQSILTAVFIQCVLWITAVIRFPEISSRLIGKTKAMA